MTVIIPFTRLQLYLVISVFFLGVSNNWTDRVQNCVAGKLFCSADFLGEFWLVSTLLKIGICKDFKTFGLFGVQNKSTVFGCC